MAFFNRGDNKFLFVAEKPVGDPGWIAYVLPDDSSYDKPGIELPQSFHELKGSYVFSYRDIDVKGALNADQFVLAVRNGMSIISPNRAMMWLTEYQDPIDPEPQDPKGPKATFVSMGFSTFQGKTTVANALTGKLSDRLFLTVTNRCLITFDEDLKTITIAENEGGKITLNTNTGSAKTEVVPNELTLSFTGKSRGVLQYGLFLREGTDFEILDFGLQFFVPDSNPDYEVAIQKYPILRSNPSSDTRVGFHCWLDLTNLMNSDDGTGTECLRTFFAFTGKNQDGSNTVLPAAYVTATGRRFDFLPWVQLGSLTDPPTSQSALMVLEANALEGENGYLVPQGDFRMRLVDASGTPSAMNLLCGLSGTETILFQPADAKLGGDHLRFVAHQPANAPIFPFPQASPTGPPSPPDAVLLNPAWKTSWATVVRADGAAQRYVAQPKGASLFGRDQLINKQHPSLLGPEEPGFQLPAGVVFPMPPYAAVGSGGVNDLGPDQLEQFDRQVISPTRRSMIGPPPPVVASATNTTKNVTTPSGIIAQVTCDANNNCEWDSIALAYNDTPANNGENLVCINPAQTPPPPEGEKLRFEFQSPSATLQQAFQSSSLFMVAANACNLGKMTGWLSESCPEKAQAAGKATFANEINIEEWVLAANVGVRNYYGDYRNVLIIKGRKGMLWDPDEEAATGLVQNPDVWTQRGDFSSPTYLQPVSETEDKLQPPDQNQQVILSQWLQDYFQDASKQEGSYFKHFNTIVKDANWTGILILRVDISCLPAGLSGILAGVRNQEDFNAHHFGINVSPVTAENVSVDQSSSMFGLINYIDPDYDQKKPEQPVEPAAGQTYDFITLTLQVLFQNTAVKNFSSYTQLTLNEFFDQSVNMNIEDGGNRYNTAILRGTYQNNGGKPVYSMSSASENNFYFDSNILNKIEIDSIQLSNRASIGKELVGWFAMSGFIDYKIVNYTETVDDPVLLSPVGPEIAFDVFSFGNDAGQNENRKGLAFSSLGLQMMFPLDGNPEGGAPPKTFAMKIDEIFFNPTISTPRKDSMYRDFVLELEGVTRSETIKTKDSEGNEKEEEDTPASRNYLPVLTGAPFTGVDGGVWWGLRFKVNMGSPGKLAGNVGLNSYLLAAWSPASSGSVLKAAVGIQLPGTGGGAKLISLQNVLKLSIGQIMLNRAVNNNIESAGDKRSWMLLFNEIAIKFLGLLKIPPGGTSTFYLFGNPKGGDNPSGLGWYAIYNKLGESEPSDEESNEVIRAV